MRERLLRDIRQNGVGAAESHDCGFAEEEAFLEQNVFGAIQEADREERAKPKRQTNEYNSPGTRSDEVGMRR